jgi:hypothetical protein
VQEEPIIEEKTKEEKKAQGGFKSLAAVLAKAIKQRFEEVKMTEFAQIADVNPVFTPN